jgi:preprotein translocase subunit YajC
MNKMTRYGTKEYWAEKTAAKQKALREAKKSGGEVVFTGGTHYSVKTSAEDREIKEANRRISEQNARVRKQNAEAAAANERIYAAIEQRRIEGENAIKAAKERSKAKLDKLIAKKEAKALAQKQAEKARIAKEIKGNEPTLIEDTSEKIGVYSREEVENGGVNGGAGGNITGAMIIMLGGLFFVAYMLIKRGK